MKKLDGECGRKETTVFFLLSGHGVGQAGQLRDGLEYVVYEMKKGRMEIALS